MGFVSFGSDGTLSKAVVCFESVAERALFLEQFVGFDDVLLGPINLERVGGCHERQS